MIGNKQVLLARRWNQREMDLQRGNWWSDFTSEKMEQAWKKICNGLGSDLASEKIGTSEKKICNILKVFLGQQILREDRNKQYGDFLGFFFIGWMRIKSGKREDGTSEKINDLQRGLFSLQNRIFWTIELLFLSTS